MTSYTDYMNHYQDQQVSDKVWMHQYFQRHENYPVKMMKHYCTCFYRAIMSEIWTIFEVVGVLSVIATIGAILAPMMLAPPGHIDHYNQQPHGFNMMNMLGGFEPPHYHNATMYANQPSMFGMLEKMLMPPANHTTHHTHAHEAKNLRLERLENVTNQVLNTTNIEHFLEGVIEGLHAPMNETVHNIEKMLL